MEIFHFNVTVVVHAGSLDTAVRKVRKTLTVAFGELGEEWSMHSAFTEGDPVVEYEGAVLAEAIAHSDRSDWDRAHKASHRDMQCGAVWGPDGDDDPIVRVGDENESNPGGE
jgi:hypothetical protein